MVVSKGKPPAVPDTPKKTESVLHKPPAGTLRRTSNELRTVERTVYYDTDLLNSLRMSVDDKIMERGIELTESQQEVYSMIFI